MSIKAMNWAMSCRTDGVSAQCVLYIVADTANENGVSIHADPDYISARTRQSRATVFRRLKELEAAGALSRFKKYRPDGAPVYEIRLHMDRHIDYDKAPQIGEGGEHEPESQIETRTGETGEVAPVRQAESQSCDSIENPSKSPEDSPLTPQEGGSEVDGWEQFKAIWEGDGVPIGRVSIAKPLFAALGPAERAQVTKAARGYLHHRSREKKPGTKQGAQTFIREIEAWPSWEKLAPPEPVVRVSYPKGSEEFRAGATLRMLAFREPLTGDVWQGPSQISPKFLAMAQFADADGQVDRSAWVILDPDTQSVQISAWRNQIKEWSGRWVELEQVPVIDPETGQPKVSIKEWNGKELRFPVRREVLIVPAEWPPRKDGSIGPPSQESQSAA